MCRLPIVLLLALLTLTAAPASAGEAGEVDATILLGGRRVEVTWTDGDTLTFRAGPRKGKHARLVGYNTLESYGPVHRWGSWSRSELHELALEAGERAAAKEWSCTLGRGKDSYGRLLLDCPEARRALLESGHGHVFAFDDPADPADLQLQREARIDKRGIWAKGLPETLVTSVRAGADGQVFLRVVTVRTGETRAMHQRQDYAVCDEICHGPEVNGSCMLFVPWELRYEDKPLCLVPPDHLAVDRDEPEAERPPDATAD
jgi:micrococcal nuclease